MKIVNLNRTFLKLMFLISILLFCLDASYAQPDLPQRTITVQATQAIDFGTFYAISAGTITVNWNGSVSTTGGVVSLSSSTVQPAIFEIKLCQGRNVTITYDPTIILTGSNGGSFTLNVGPTEEGVSGSEFPVDNDCNFITTLRVGGTLEVPGSSPAGFYSGIFSIDFTQE
jgi:Domain of unknown function (DUF4402)